MTYLEDESFGYDLPAICDDAEKGKCFLMQSAGLRDRNGKLIYEGDIIQYELYKQHTTYIGLVKWMDRSAKFYIKSHQKDLDIDSAFEIEVIGNIHENPELIIL